MKSARWLFMVALLVPGLSFAQVSFPIIDVGLGVGIPEVDGEFLKDIDPDAGMALDAGIGVKVGSHFASYLDCGFVESSASGLDFTETYIGLNLRFLLPPAGRSVLYFQGGPAIYMMAVTGTDGDLKADQVTGASVGAGWQYRPAMLESMDGRVGIDLKYHFETFDEGDADLDAGNFDVELGRANMFMVMFSLGYTLGEVQKPNPKPPVVAPTY